MDKMQGGNNTPEQSGSSSSDRSRRKEDAKLRHLTRLSLVLAILTAAVLWRSRGEPLLVVWRFSQMHCFGSFFWTSFFTETMGRRTLFLYLSYGLLLAYYAHSALNPATGALVAHLSSQFAAGLLGYALAERRQRQRTERSAHAVTFRNDDGETRRLRFTAGPVLGLAGAVAWLACHSADFGAYELVSSALVLHTAALIIGIIVVALFQLRGRLISPEEFGFVMIYTGCIALLYVSDLFLGEAASTIATWVALLLLTELFCYCVRVHATLKQLRASLRESDEENRRRLNRMTSKRQLFLI